MKLTELIDRALQGTPTGTTLLVGKVDPEELAEAKKDYPGYLITVEGNEVKIRRT